MDSLPAGLGGGSDPVGTAPSLNALLTPSKEETAAQSSAVSSSKEAQKQLKSSAALETDLAQHLAEAPDPAKFKLGPQDLEDAKPQKQPEYRTVSTFHIRNR